MSSRKPQPTLHGYTAWVLGELMKKKGLSAGRAAAWIIDRWVDENAELLERGFSIDRAAYEREVNPRHGVVPHPSSRSQS